MNELQKQTQILRKIDRDNEKRDRQATTDRNEAANERDRAAEAAKTPAERESEFDFKIGAFGAFVGLLCASLMMQLFARGFPALFNGPGVFDYARSGKLIAIVLFPVLMGLGIWLRGVIFGVTSVAVGGIVLWHVGVWAVRSFLDWLNA